MTSASAPGSATRTTTPAAEVSGKTSCGTVWRARYPERATPKNSRLAVTPVPHEPGDHAG